MRLSNFLIFLAVMIGIYLGVKFYWNYLLSAPLSEARQNKRFVVFKGESACQVGERLENDGLIKFSQAFCFLAKYTDGGDKIQEGDFNLSSSMTAREVLRQLREGVLHQWVTLLEGWRVEEMADKLSEELKIPNKEFLRFAKEGYMFPDTYLFGPQDSGEKIVQKMEENFNQKYDADLQDKIKQQNLTAQEGIILASIVEREARSEEARKMVASILLKRLRIGMPLQADATIQYALFYQSREKSWWKKKLNKEDFQVNSPYNTYLYPGLPPGPICNPGLSSLLAVAKASDTPYLYYYHDSKGVPHYATTLEEHNKNIADYP